MQVKEDYGNRNENKNLKETFKKTTKREKHRGTQNTQIPNILLSSPNLQLLELEPDLSQMLSRWENATSR